MTISTIIDVVDIQGVVVLSLALAEEPEDHIQAATACSLGQIGRHTPEHSKAVAEANVFPRLLQCYMRTGASEDLQTKVGLLLSLLLHAVEMEHYNIQVFSVTFSNQWLNLFYSNLCIVC